MLPERADRAFEGGGVKGIALAGGIVAAEQAGVREWVNVAGTSAGAIVTSLLAVGCRGERLRTILAAAGYPRFADFGRGGRWAGGLANAVSRRGLVRGE